MADAVIDLASLDTATDSTAADTGTQESSSGIVSSTETVPENQTNQQSTETSGEDASGKAIRDAIRRLSAQSPEDAKLLKQLADTHFREATGWKGAFQTPQEAAQAKSIIESAGGIEGIAAAQERLQAYDTQESGLESGDPSVLDSFFEDYPQGAAQLAPHYLAKLEALNPQALQAAVGPYAVSILVQAGLQGHLESMANETDPARAKAMAQQALDWMKGQAQNAQQIKQTPRQSPEADRIKQERVALNEEREQIFRTGVTERVNSTVVAPLGGIVDQYAKQYKLNDTQKAHYRQSLEQAVIQEMNADQAYLKQAELRNSAKNRTPEGVASFIAGEFTRRAKDKAFEVAKAIYGAPRATPGPIPGNGQPKAGTPKTAPSGGPLRISARPSDSQLDLTRPGADLLLIQGRGYLKDGRFVTWRG